MKIYPTIEYNIRDIRSRRRQFGWRNLQGFETVKFLLYSSERSGDRAKVQRFLPKAKIGEELAGWRYINKRHRIYIYVMYVSDKIEMQDTKKGKSIFAIDGIVKDEVVFEFEKNFLEHPTKTSMQIDKGIHQESTHPEAVENFLNHSCNPNGYIDFQDLTYRALHPIKKGEELTFNYLTTEWKLANKFDCECGSEKCYGQIRGFKYLTLEQQIELEPLLSPFFKKKLKEAESQPAN